MTESDTNGAIKKKYACSTCGDEFDGDSDVCPFDGTKLTPLAQQLAPGTVLAGRFEVIQPLAEGGMGTIYKATHKLMKRTVALKTVQTATMSGAGLKRFQQEAQALSVLNHPNILSVFDFFISDDGQPYLVMDYLEGKTLEKIRVQWGPMPTQRAVNIFAQVCAGLDHAHRHGIIHRDIKPSNIMLVEQEGQTDIVKIVDFGIAKLRMPDEPTAHLTDTGDSFGTPQYMSPEQCHASPLDARSDIYSLGCVMYASLTGSPPFPGGDSMECMYKQCNEKPAPFAKDLDCVPALEAIVMKALAKDPAERFQTAKELEEAINAVGVAAADASDSGATATGAAAVTTPGTASAGTGSNGTGGRKPAPPRLPGRIALSIGMVAAMIVVFVANDYYTYSSKKTPRPVSMPPAQSVVPTTASADSTAPSLSETPTPVGSATPAAPPTDEEVYASNMALGHKSFAASDYEQAQKYFNAAHRAAENFGDVDSRFLESMQWQGKVAGALGDTALQHEAEHYIDVVRERQRKALHEKKR